ncbi:MAG: AI-2E family transporter [Planctomycetes bacterium]|nr:AI-2E family transporter [Planctomycetota bacterium]MCB9905541.1 AI-2E family transporter [Planctomycetota bacterium]
MPPLDRDQRIQTTCLLILSGVAIALSLYWLKGVMVPFVLAVFLSFALAPLIDVLIRRARFPRAVALGVTVTLALALMMLFGGLVTNSIRNMAPNLDRLETGIVDLLDGVASKLHLDELQDSIAEWTRDEGPAADSGAVADSTTPDVADENADAGGTELEGSPSLIAAIGRRVVPAIGNVLNGITTLLSKSVLVMIFLMFLLGGRQNFDIRENRTTLGVVERQVRSYLLTKIIASLATGVLTAIALRMIGVPSAMLFGLLAFLLNFIPSIGSILAALLPVPMALITFDLGTSSGIVSVILTLAVPGSIQFLIGNVIEPKVMGDSLDLHPVVVMLSLIFWGTIWGPIGMLLATPITAVIRLMLEKLEPTQPIARAMSGKLGG